MRFTLFRDRAGEWRWRLIARNGRIIADSGEGYARRASAMEAVRRVRRLAPKAALPTPKD